MSARAILKIKGRQVTTIRSSATIREAVALLARQKIGALVVSDDGVTVGGILSERDVIRSLDEYGPNLPGLLVRDVMTRPVTTAAIDTHILDVLKLMTDRRFRHVPIVEDGRLAGIVSIGDAVKARLELLESETNHLKEYIGGR